MPFSKTAVLIHYFEAGSEFRTVEILCEKYHARMILAAAEMYCPEAAAEIRSPLNFPARPPEILKGTREISPTVL